jgi:hypothetical protein
MYLISFLFMGIVFAIALLSSVCFGVRVRHKKLMSALPLGIALGCVVFGVISIFKHFETLFAPHTPYAGFSNELLPVVGILLSHFVLHAIPAVLTLMAMFAVIEMIVQRFGYRWLQLVLFVLAGIVISDVAQLANIPLWIASGIAIGLMWYVIYRYFLVHDSDLVWIIVVTVQLLRLLPSAWYQAYPGIEMHVLGSSILIWAILAWVYRKI